MLFCSPTVLPDFQKVVMSLCDRESEKRLYDSDIRKLEDHLQLVHISVSLYVCYMNLSYLSLD